MPLYLWDMFAGGAIALIGVTLGASIMMAKKKDEED